MATSPALDARPAHRVSVDRASRSAAPPTFSGHIPELDGVRGLAILLVLFYHFTLEMSGSDIITRVLIKAASAGWCGVDLFFVLSGFLITGILADTKDAPHRFRNFYARRALRIFPLYYFILAVVFTFLPLISRYVGGTDGLKGTWVWLGLYATNVLVAIRRSWFPLSHFWSLAVEEHFYLFWPVVIFGFGRRTSMKVSSFIVVQALLSRVCLVARGEVLATYCLTPCRVDALAIGGFLALAVRGPGGLKAMIPACRWIGMIGLGGIVVIAAFRHGLAFHDPFVQIAGYLLLDLLFASSILLILASDRDHLTNRIFNLSPLRWFGRYSYGLYVYNSLFLLIAEGLSLHAILMARTGSTIIAYLLYIVTAFSSTFATSWLSWHLLEKHFLKLKHHFPSATNSWPSGLPKAGVAGDECSR